VNDFFVKSISLKQLPGSTALCALAALVRKRPIRPSVRQRAGHHPLFGFHGI
jgi:hypothetical protein